MEYNEALEKLKNYGQEQVLAWYDTLSEADKASLLREIGETDLEPLMGFRAALEPKGEGEKIEPLAALELPEIEKDRKKDEMEL